MTLPCEQTATINAIHETLKRVDRTQDRLVVTLERVAEQGARIDNLEAVKDYHTEQIDELYVRMRKSETVSEKLDNKIVNTNSKLDILFNKYTLGFFISIIFLVCLGTVLDCIYHSVAIKAIINFVRGA